jgi:hypothetical protein
VDSWILKSTAVGWADVSKVLMWCQINILIQKELAGEPILLRENVNETTVERKIK